MRCLWDIYYGYIYSTIFYEMFMGYILWDMGTIWDIYTGVSDVSMDSFGLWIDNQILWMGMVG